ncbi:hypothetical protein MMYC01_208744 [Madurella mycetomatis]|uniref:Pentatricopeptide repeat-containing protein, mitochondrial n=1 Tax=Madurella mycetomatis TaxID=100816 RepID=A0A175VPZ2_9PEZI|nr:hypothetical protein MMYC01_210083 [Madurella mycetomatis]KXX75172.1 hypothetical protein MMYC01_208744 [Madurella mycetomatis]
MTMRELGTVCLRCQFRRLVTSRARARRGALSYSTYNPAVDENQSHDADWNARSTAVFGQAWDRKTQAGASPPPPCSSTQRRSPSLRGASLAMFQNIVERQSQASTTQTRSLYGNASVELVKDVATMQTMLEREGATLEAAYAFFMEAVYPQVTDAGRDVPQIIKNQIGTVLLDRLAIEKARAFDSPDLPSVTRITEIMVQLDVLRPIVWATLVLELIQHICRQSPSPNDYTSIENYESAMAIRNAFLRDLVGAWKVFAEQRSLAKEDSPAGSSEQRQPQSSSGPADAKQQRRPTLWQAFGTMFPMYPPSTLLRPTCAAYATYKLLIDPFNRTRSVEQEAAPFLQIMKALIFQSRPPRPGDFSALLESFPDIRYMQSRKYAKDRGTAFLKPVSIPQASSHDLRNTVHRQLGSAIRSRNLGTVKKAWLDFWGDTAKPDDARIRELTKFPELFDYFILAYMTLRRPELAIRVWNNMERIGIKPTVKTWNSMLQGCAKASNADGIKTVWQKLIASGTKLDTAIWTARIHGLFVSGDPDAGLRALDEMVKVWEARSNPANQAIAVQLTAEPVNAALAGLLRLERDADAKRVLAWAAKQGVEPDIYTFNTLLRPLLRRGDMAAVDELFDTMRSVNINADVTTFTVMLEGTLTNIGNLEPAEQVALVRRILAEMKSSGIEANMQTYAKILYLLLREGGDRANEPVKAVLAHIWRRGLELTSHIYTMLAEHYFSRDPPDAGAVTTLIENRRLHDNKDIDRVFWERVIKGYCHAGETERALGIFDKVFVSGTNITISTLHDLLRAVIESGEMGAAARIVEAAGRIGRADEHAGPSSAAAATQAEKKRLFKHRFWHLAHQHGLLGDQLGDSFKEALRGGQEWW